MTALNEFQTGEICAGLGISFDDWAIGMDPDAPKTSPDQQLAEVLHQSRKDAAEMQMQTERDRKKMAATTWANTNLARTGRASRGDLCERNDLRLRFLATLKLFSLLSPWNVVGGVQDAPIRAVRAIATQLRRERHATGVCCPITPTSVSCKHGRLRLRCRLCTPKKTRICEHGRRRRQCKQCGGGAICEHGAARRRVGIIIAAAAEPAAHTTTQSSADSCRTQACSRSRLPPK